MRGTSRVSLQGVADRFEPVLVAVGPRAAEIGEQMFALVDALEGNGSLRRTLTDPSIDAEAKVGLARRLLADARPEVGDVVAVDPSAVHALLDAGRIPIVATVARGGDGMSYNVNADTIAAALAVALRADKLFLLTNVPGIMRDPADPASRIPALDAAGVAALIAGGVIAGGMIPKAQNAVAALEAGAARVHILNGAIPESLLLASFARDDLGTQIVR